MANLKISELQTATPAGSDLVPIVDVSDTSMGPSGSTRKATVASLPFDATGTAASAVASHVGSTDPHGDRAYAAALVSALSSVYQPLDADLTAIAALSTTTFGRALLTLADAAAARTTLGVPAGSGTSTGTNTGDQDLSSYATTAAVAAGYQPLDSDLTAIAALSTTTFGRSLLTLADAAALRTSAGATTVGGNLFTLTNPGAVRFLQINANNTVTANDAAAQRTALGLGAAALASGYDLVSALVSAEISVTGAGTTATLGRWHVCSGTSADYTLTLPSPTGNAGKLIGVRMSAALTRFVTLDAGTGVLIDGQQTRVMWSQEAAVLLCDGTGWAKVAGRTRPMSCNLAAATSQSAANATETKITIGTTISDPTGLMADTANSRIQIKRPASYLLTPLVRMGNVNTGRVNSWARKNGSGYLALSESPMYGLSVVTSVSLPATLAAGDYLELWAFHGGGAGLSSYGSGGQDGSNLAILEVPQW